MTKPTAPSALRLRSLSRLALGGAEGNWKEEVVRALRLWRREVTPETVAALVDRIEALADEVDSEPTAVREPATSVQIGRAQVADEIRAALRKPLDTEDDQ